jgi:hypothetical protein
MSKKDDALDELYICSMELALFLSSAPKSLSAAKAREMEQLMDDCEGTKTVAFIEGATKAEVKKVVAGAKEDAGLIDEMAASGMKITVEL